MGPDPIAAAVRGFRLGIDREGSFRLLVERHSARLEGFFGRRGCGGEEARDLTQQTFLGAYQCLGDLRQEADFPSWLFRIAKTTWLKHLRAARAAKRAAQTTSLDELAERDAAPGQPPRQLEDVLRQERIATLRAAVEELPAQMRRCLVLRTYQQRSLEEIAVLLRLSVGTVKAHLFQARQKLRDKLGAPLGEPVEP